MLRAQPPGYQGRLQVYSLRLASFPAWGRTSPPAAPFHLDLRPEFQMEQVLGRQYAFVSTASFSRTPFPYDFEGRRGQVRLWGGSAGLGLRSYTFRRRGNLAPLGLYQQIDLYYTVLGLTDLNRHLFPDHRRRLGRRQDLVMALSVGTQRVWQDRWSLQAGFQTAWVWGGVPITDSEVEAYLWTETTARLRAYWGFNVFVSMGLLGPRP